MKSIAIVMVVVFAFACGAFGLACESVCNTCGGQCCCWTDYCPGGCCSNGECLGPNTCKCVSAHNNTTTIQFKASASFNVQEVRLSNDKAARRTVCTLGNHLVTTVGSCSPMPSPTGGQCANYACVGGCGFYPYCSCYSPEIESFQRAGANCTILSDMQLETMLEQHWTLIAF